jgi:hypothetical protein
LDPAMPTASMASPSSSAMATSATSTPSSKHVTMTSHVHRG